MKKLLAVLVASTFAVGSAAALAADPPKDKAAMPAAAKLEKPANVTAEAWGKMSDAEKQKAVDAAKAGAKAAAPAAGAAAAMPPKKEKKGGC